MLSHLRVFHLRQPIDLVRVLHTGVILTFEGQFAAQFLVRVFAIVLSPKAEATAEQQDCCSADPYPIVCSHLLMG